MLRASWFPGADPAARTQLLDDGAHGSFLSALMWVIIGTVPAEIFSYDPSRAIKVAPSTRGASASSGLMRVARLAGQPFRAALGNR